MHTRTLFVVALLLAAPFTIAAAEAEGKAVVVQPKQSLWGISKQVTGDPSLWPLLFRDNQGELVDPSLIQPGQELRYQPEYPKEEKRSARKQAWGLTDTSIKQWVEQAGTPVLTPSPQPTAAAVEAPADTRAAQLSTPVPTAEPSQAPTAALTLEPTALPTAEAMAPAARGGLYVGVGWPEAKLRYGFQAPVDLELKAAFGEGMQVYSARTYWTYLGTRYLDLTLGLDGGYMLLSGAEGLSGAGANGGLFMGLEAPLGRWLRVALDFGPTYLEAHSEGQSVSALEWVVTTGLYLRLF